MNDLLGTCRIAIIVATGIGLADAGHAQVAVQAEAGTPLPASTASEAPAPQVSDAPSDEIIVSARKRDETLISVPVVVTAISGEQLASRGITNLDGISRATPQLIIGVNGPSGQGGSIALRGVSGPDDNPFGDQAVSFNIDGVQIAKSSVRRMSDFDVAQVEVLKGPQALFFGKNSPAGIVSIRTADPTRTFEAKASAGYEFHAHQIRTEGYVSGPLSETLGLRIAGLFSDMRGDLKDLTPDGPYKPRHGHNPNGTDWGVRGTLRWDPADDFDARLKVNYSRTKNNGAAATTAFTSCPLGARFTGSGINQCKASDGANSNAGYGTLVSTLGSTLNRFRDDGENFSRQNQWLAGLELNWRPSDSVTLTSVTGFYDVSFGAAQNYENDTNIILPSYGFYDNTEFSQEVRIGTDFDGPLNFNGGVYYSNTRSAFGALSFVFGSDFDLFGPGFGGPTTPAQLANFLIRQRAQAYSAYLQVSYKPVEQVELNVGGRYSKEDKRLPLVRSGGGLADGVLPGVVILDESTEIGRDILPRRKDSWNDFSPEVTMSYRPSDRLTLFGSYKHGFLSGGFNSGAVSFGAPNLDLSYDPTTIKGFEASVKAELFDRTLRTNLAVYTYKVKDQQVTNITNATTTISNAGAVSVKGVEFDLNWRTPIEGFSVRGAAAYNRGRYTSYPNAPCYGGQTVAQGCANGVFQDLSNSELIRAPKWNLNAGLAHQTPLGNALKLGLSADVVYSSSYLTDSSSAPNGRQAEYALVDATARIGSADAAWELALIGRNLTNKYFVVATNVVTFATNPNGGLLDRFGSLNRGREVMLRASYKFSGR